MSLQKRQDVKGTSDSVMHAPAEVRKYLQARRDFISHLVAYGVDNGFLVGVWAFAGGDICGRLG